MILLCMAHRGEAQSFLKAFNFKYNEKDGIYLSDNLALLITGEGIYEVFTKLGPILGKYQFSNIVNYGIAGALTKEIELGHIYKIRTSYSFSDESPRFHSISSEGDFDCISTDKRVLTDQFASKLSNFSEIVDRELWAIFKLAKDQNIEFHSFKLISDIAGAQTACFDIKEKALEFSNKMLKHFMVYLNKDENVTEERENLCFSTSFTIEKRIYSLLEKLGIETKDINNLFKELKTQNPKLNDKGLSKILIKELETKLNPLDSLVQKHFIELTNPLKEVGAKCFFNHKVDKKSFSISMEVNSQTNLTNLSNVLSQMNFSDFEKIYNGEIDV